MTLSRVHQAAAMVTHSKGICVARVGLAQPAMGEALIFVCGLVCVWVSPARQSALPVPYRPITLRHRLRGAYAQRAA
jgi:hypothetical protein